MCSLIMNDYDLCANIDRDRSGDEDGDRNRNSSRSCGTLASARCMQLDWRWQRGNQMCHASDLFEAYALDSKNIYTLYKLPISCHILFYY